jgi:hypothetical protein
MPPETIIPEPLPAAAAPEPVAAAVETAAVPAVETAAAAVPGDHTATPTLLGKFGKEDKPAETATDPVVEAPPAETKPAEAAVETKPVETKPFEPPAPAAAEPITYPDWKLPEGIQADKDQIAKYTEALGEHRIDPDVGQKLIDMHTAALQTSMQQYADHLAREQHRVFGETRQAWAKEVLADQEIGGAGHQTAMGVIARMRDALVSNHRHGTPEYKADVAAFDQFLTVTGAGDHPLFLKMLYRVGKFLDEPAMPAPNVKPSPNNGKPPGDGKRIQYKTNA